MSEFNKFTEKFDEAVKRHDVDAAANAMVDYVTEHSRHTRKSLADSFGITRSWMGYEGGQNREASTRNTTQGWQAIAAAATMLGIPAPAP